MYGGHQTRENERPKQAAGLRSIWDGRDRSGERGGGTPCSVHEDYEGQVATLRGERRAAHQAKQGTRVWVRLVRALPLRSASLQLWFC